MKRTNVVRARTTRPEVILGGVFKVTSGLKVVAVKLFDNSKDGRKQLARFCHANGLHMGGKSPEGFVEVTGSEDDLLRLDTTRFWANQLITEWHWIDNVQVHGGSGSGEKPKRKHERSVRTVMPGKEAMQQIAEQAEMDARHAVNPDDPKTARLHGDEVLDKIESAKVAEQTKERNEFYGQFGLSAPTY